MIRLVRAELLKARTTKLVPVLVAVALGLVLLGLVLTLATATDGPSDGPVQAGVDVSTRDGVRQVLGAASGAGQLVLVIGIILITGEYRHATITTTFLVEARRSRVLTAKLAAAVTIGGVTGLLCVAPTLAVAVPWLRALGADVPGSEIVGIGVGSIGTAVFWCAFGLAIGALIRNQVAAIVVGLVGASILTSILFAIWPDVGRYLPSAAAAAISGGGDDALSPAGGIALMVAYVAGLMVPAFLLTARRDVT